MRRAGWLMIMGLVVMACSTLPVSSSATAAPPDACTQVATDDQGNVVAFFSAPLDAIKRLPAVNSNPQLAGFPDDASAIVCYVDGDVPKGPPPRPSGSIPPSFDRDVLVVVGDSAFQVAPGYKAALPIESP
jgi:hypothetical protein